MFKLLAIRPLEGCASNIQKCLKTGLMYYFCNDYIIEPGSHIRRRSKNIKPLKEDFFTVVSESDNNDDNSSNETSPTVSVSAIVGMNGDGKSTLVELMMRLINNCAISYKLSASSDSLRRVKGVNAELYYMVDNVIYRMAEEEKQDKTQIWKMVELDDKEMRWEMNQKEIERVDDDLNCFFFTMVSNYSHYAYNTDDCKKEWEESESERGVDENCWLHYIFHKNDVDLCPVTVHPFRNRGNIDVNNEKNLSKQRLFLLFLNADNPFENEHSFRRVNGKDASVLKLEEEKKSKLQQIAIIEYFKTVNYKNRFDIILQKIEEIDKRIDESSYMVIQDKNKNWLDKYNDLVAHILPSSFIYPVKHIIEQDTDFNIFVSEVAAWLNSIDDNNLHNIGDINFVIEQYYNLYEKVRNVNNKNNNNYGISDENEVDKDSAISDYVMTENMDLKEADAHFNLGSSYYQKGDYDAAIYEFDMAIKCNPKFEEAYYKRGNANCKIDDYDAAIWDYSKVINLNPKNVKAYYDRGNVNYSAGDFESAIIDYGKAIALKPKNARVYISRGDANYKIGNYDAAISDYSNAINLNLKNAKAYFNRGNIFYQKGDYDAAILDYGKTINLDSKNADAYFNRGNVFYQKGDYDAAIWDYGKAINLNPKDADAYFNRGNVFYQKGDYDAAIWDYGKAINLNPKDANVYFNQGNSYYQKGDYDAAIYEYNIAIRIRPRFGEAYHNRGNAYFNMGEFVKAIDEYSKEIELYPMNAEAYYNRGNAHFSKGDYDKAIDDYDKALKYPANKGTYVNVKDDDEWIEGLNLKDANVYNNRGNANLKKGVYKEAVRDYSMAIDLNPKNAEAYYNRGRVYDKMNNKSMAEEDYFKVMQLDSEYVKKIVDNDGVFVILKNDGCIQLGNADAMQLIRIKNKREVKDIPQPSIWRFHNQSEKKIQYSLESIKEFEFVDKINAAQLGRLDTLYRIMKSYHIDSKIVTKNYSDLSIIEKCQHYIVYKVCSILSAYSLYQDASDKDELESLREYGTSLERYIEDIKNDRKSHATRKLRQLNNFIGEVVNNVGLYERIGKKDEKDNLLVEIDDLKKHYKGKSTSLDNLPPPIYKWDIIFKKKEDPKCEIELDTFSSGEKQMLNSIGDIIYHLQNFDNTSSEAKNNNVNLIMEEIELYYHPEYQRLLFSRLLDLIQRAKLGNIKNINIVFVTHSPFILSDIPKCNVLFLRGGMPDDELQENTFGANIHSLLKHGFFMPNLPIGEFAYGKINTLFKKLNSGDFRVVGDLDDIYQEILLVGEPFLRNQLLLLYNSYKGKTITPINPIKEETAYDILGK